MYVRKASVGVMMDGPVPAATNDHAIRVVMTMASAETALVFALKDGTEGIVLCVSNSILVLW